MNEPTTRQQRLVVPLEGVIVSKSKFLERGNHKGHHELSGTEPAGQLEQ